MVRRSSDKVFKKLDKKIKEREEAGPFGTPGQKPKKKKSSKRPAKKPAKKEDLLKSLKIRKVSKHDQTFFKKGLEFFRMFYQKIKKQKIKKVLEEKILVDLLKRKKKKKPASIFELIKIRPIPKPKIRENKGEQEIAKKILLQTIMTRNPVSIDMDDTISHALEYIVKYNIRGIPVTQDGKIVGTLEEGDILRYFKSKIPIAENAIQFHQKELEELGNLPVGKIKMKRAVILSPNDSVEKAIKKMHEREVGRICVMENDRLMGIVTKDDIVKALIKSTISSRPITSEVMRTDIDKLLELIEEQGRITTEDAAEKLKIEQSLVEDWASILENHDLIKIEYPLIGTVELVKKEE